MSEMGKAMMGTGEADGDNRAIEAAEKAISNPLLDGVSMKGAKGVIISITGGEDMRLMEVDEAASHIKELVDPDANIIWGSAFNNDLGGKIRVSVVATGIEAEVATQPVQGKVFTFPAARTTASSATPAATPVTAPTAHATPARADEGAASTDLNDEREGEGEGDELMLGADDILTSPVGSAPIAPPADDEVNEPAARPTAARESGTLFERMSNIARGAAKAQGDDEPAPEFRREPIDIPRFLNRQNNQELLSRPAAPSYRRGRTARRCTASHKALRKLPCVMAIAMASFSKKRIRVASLILGGVGLTLALSSAQAPAQTAQRTYVQRETASAALARHIRVLATSPRDFGALIGAGKAALALGDTQSAVGFFGRAEEIAPRSPLPLAGMGAAMAADGDGSGALGYFSRAQQFGASIVVIGADRGLAYDLLGRHSDAQTDYRAAMLGTDADEARRRLALSLAITGDKAGALQALAPLSARGDAAAARCRALVLALSGDQAAARRSLDIAMPGSSVHMAPFLAKLPSLRSDQKAAAVNLGIFPATGQSAYAYVQQPSAGPSPARLQPAQPSPAQSPRRRAAGAVPMSGDRLASIDSLLKSSPGSTSPPLPVAPSRIASITPDMRARLTPSGALSEVKPRVWVQLASGPNATALPDQFRRIKSRHKTVFEGISGYVAEAPDRARLLIGPFKNRSDANIFVEDLESVNVTAFSWTSRPGDAIRKLPF
jgi:Flp pilus assembly protein TadD